MKILCLITLFVFIAPIAAQTHKLEKLWETDAVVAVPESVLPYDKGKKLYVSLIDGPGWEADGKGGIAKLNADGTNLDQTWVTGLNAPKGMALVRNRLYVADIKEVVVIDTKKRKVEKKIAVEGATGLNDITADENGIVYVSDSRNARVWRIEKDVATLFLENIKGVNGLRTVGQTLLIGAGKFLQKTDASKAVTSVAEMPGGIDGIEPVGNGDLLVTSWAGQIFYVYANGQIEPLLDTRQEKKNSADIGYDSRRKILFVPTFNGKTVTAYQLR